MAILNIVEELTGEAEVWIDVPGAELSGIIIGVGETRAEAITDAVRTLEALTEQLQSPPEVWVTDATRYGLNGTRRDFTITTHCSGKDI